jgi:hypothetical protein
MASIAKVSGNHNKALSNPNSKWVIMADEVNLFEVPDWIPQPSKDPKTGVLTPVNPTEIETPAKVTWKIKDTSGKNVLSTFNGNVLDKAKMKINKKYSGSYGYMLEATNDVSKDKTSTFVLGNCESKIVTAQWSKQEGASIQDEINYGQSIYVTLDTEGLNGDKLTLELYNKKDEKKVLGTVTGDCINGDVTVKMPTIGALKPPGKAKTLEDLEDFIIKVKNPVGVYIKKGGDDKVVTFKIKNKTAPEEPVAPANITPLKVGEPDKAPESMGILSLEKIAVKTTYDVCNDEVGDFSDFKNFWILENDGKYYHWLKKSLIGLKEADDKKKPTPIPITLTGSDNFSFKATFKTILPLDGVGVRVRDRDNKYIFTTMSHPKKAKGDLYEIEFKSTNTPYKDSIQYFSTFELIFDYSLDAKSWTPMGSAQFCFYLTWKEPVFSKFEISSPINQSKDMKIECTKSGKKNILETLLWLGCHQGKSKGKSEEEILDATFKQFETLNVERVRKAGAMGYWRSSSSAKPTKAFGQLRSLRYLLTVGEARCGEWTDFMMHLAFTQGIVNVEQFIIITEASKIAYLPLISKTTGSGSTAVTDYSVRVFDDTKITSTGDFPYTNYPVPAKNVPDYAVIKGDTISSGYDTTSGAFKTSVHDTVPYDGHISDIIKYDKYIDSIFLVKTWKINDPNPPEQLSASAQGNKNPLNFFWDHVFVMFVTGANKKYYDPSYGAKSTKYYPDKKTLLADYSKAALSAVVSASMPKAGGGKVFEDKVHTKEFVDLFKSTFQASSTSVQAYKYKSYITKMEDHLIMV